MNSNITKVQKGGRSSNGFIEGDWQERLTSIIDAMREMSLQSDPVKMVQAYGARVRQWMPSDRWLSVSSNT